MSNTSFLGNSVNIDGTYIPGGGSANAVDENTDGSGGNGKDGLYPFNDPSFGKRYGASGGGGAAKAGKSGGFGGFTGGGKGGDSTKNRNGSDATFFGGGGGGGGLMYEYLPIGEGGKGYQGIIILRYKKYK